MLIVLHFLFLFCCYFRPKSKKLMMAFLVFLWFIAAFCTNHADFLTYTVRYNDYLSVASITEVGFNALMKICNVIGLDFQTFLCISYAFILGTIGWFIVKFFNNCAFALGLYSIFPYCIDMVQLRNSLAFALCLIGINQLIQSVESKNTKHVVLFTVLIACASSFHFSTILFLILLVPYYCGAKKNFVITAVLFCILEVVISTDFVARFASIFMYADRVNMILARIQKYDVHNIHTIQLAMILSTIITGCLLWATKYNLVLENRNGSDPTRSEKNIRVIDYIIALQVVAIVIIPMIPFALDIYRIHRYILLIGILFVSLYGDVYSHVRLVNIHLFRLVAFVSIWLVFFLQIYCLNNFESTYLALFTNNAFLR